MPRRVALRLSLVSSASFLALLFLLHFVEPEFNLGHMISEYQLGGHGWLMSLAFSSLGVSSLLLLSALRGSSFAGVGRIGRWGMAIVAMAHFCAAAFPPIPAPAIEGYLHGVGGTIIIVDSPIVFTSISRGVSRVDDGQISAGLFKWATGIVWIGLLLFGLSGPIFPIVSAASPLALMSVFNRMMIVTYCGWLMVVAAHSARDTHN
jgi:Protein of unknown function (DUF998)